jgi:hypothetical protein
MIAKDRGDMQQKIELMFLVKMDLSYIASCIVITKNLKI